MRSSSRSIRSEHSARLSTRSTSRTARAIERSCPIDLERLKIARSLISRSPPIADRSRQAHPADRIAPPSTTNFFESPKNSANRRPTAESRHVRASRRASRRARRRARRPSKRRSRRRARARRNAHHAYQAHQAYECNPVITKLITIQLKSITAAPITAKIAVHSPLSFTR